VLPIDLAVPEGAETIVEATLATHGRLDIPVSDYRAVAGVLHVPFLTPFDAPTVVTAENHVVGGGLASLVAEALFDAELIRPMSRIGLPTASSNAARSPGCSRSTD
jgi:transketolase